MRIPASSLTLGQSLGPRRGVAVLVTAAAMCGLALLGATGGRAAIQGQDAPTVAIAGQLGGAGTSLALAGDGSAWVGNGPRVSGLAAAPPSGAEPDAGLALTSTWSTPPLAGVVRGVVALPTGVVAVGDVFGVAAIDGEGAAWRGLARGFDGRALFVDAAGATAVVAARDGRLHVAQLGDGLSELLSSVEVAVLAGPTQVEDVTAAAVVGQTWWLALTARAELPVAWLVPVDVSEPEKPRVGVPHALEVPLLDLAATADGRLLALEERRGLVVWDVSDPQAPARLGQLPLARFGAPACCVAGDPNDATIAWVAGSATNTVAGTGMVWRVDLADPAAPAVAGVAETELPGVALRIDGEGRAWLLHPQRAVTVVDAAALGAPDVGTAPAVAAAWHAPGGVRAAAQSADGRLALATGWGGVWVMAPDGAGGFKELGRHRLAGEVDGLIWAGADAQGRQPNVLWLTTQRPGTLQALRVPLEPGGPFVELGRMEGLGTPVSLAEDVERALLYVADAERGLWLISADVAAPKLHSRAREVTEAWDVLPDGERAWVAAGDRGVLWLDTIDPRATSPVFWLNTPGTAFGLAAFGSHVLVADLEAGVQTARTLRGQAMPGDELRVGQVTDVAAVGGFGYAALVGTGIFEFDPRDIRVLVGRRELRLAGLVRRVEAAPTRAVNEPGAPQEQARLLAAAGEGGVYWLDVDAPPSPPTATPRPTGSPSPTPSFPAYVPWAGTGREEPPFVLAEQGSLSAEALGGREVTGVALHGARAVVGLSRVRGGEDAGLAVLALDESPPRLVGRHEQLAVAPRDLAFDGERVTVAAWTDGLRMLRLDGLGRFEPLGGLSMTLRAAHLAVAPSAGDGGAPGGGASGEGPDVADVLYVSGTRLDPGPRAGLVAVDAADPSALAALGAVRVPDVTALARGDGALYALDYTAGLRVLDVSDPLTLTEGALLPLPGAVDVAADGRGRVVLAVRTNGGAIDGGLIVLDAADPLSPTLAGRWRRGADDPGAWARFVALSEVADVGLGAGAVSGSEVLTRTVAWLAGERDLHVVDVSDPAAPLLLAAKRLEPGGVIGLAVQGRQAVLLHRTRGAVVLALE